MAAVVVPPGTPDLSTVDPGSGTDPHAWYFYEGNQTITAGTNFSARAAQTSVFIAREAPVRFSSTWRSGITGEFRIEAAGGLLNIQADDSGTNIIAKLSLLGNMKVVDIGGGTWTAVELSAGECSIAEGTVVTGWDQSGGSHTIGYNATGLSTLNNRNGILHCRRLLASDAVCYFDGNSQTYFRRAQQVASPGITASGSNAAFHICGSAYVKWCGLAMQAVYLDSDNAVFDWYDMPAGATIANVVGSAKAIANVGLRQGSNILRNGGTLTVTALTAKGGRVENINPMPFYR